MDGGAWWAAVHGVATNWTRLSHFTFTFHFHALEKEMATHSSVVAWRIPGMGEPGALLSMGSHRVRHDWSDFSSSSSTYIWNLERQYWWIYLQGSNGETDIRGQTYGHRERGGEDEMYGESNMETYITICEIDNQRQFVVWLRKVK